MPEYLVEAYFSSHGRSSDVPTFDDIAEAADAITREGHDVCLASIMVIPEDETCLYLFDAGSADAVVRVAARVGLRFEHLVEDVSTRTFPRTARQPTELPSVSTSPTRGVADDEPPSSRRGSATGA